MDTPAADFHRIIETLSRHGVDYVIVGGVCAVLQGAPVSTFDLDIVHSREEANIDRLLAGLAELDTYYRGRGDQRIEPGRDQLASRGHQLLMTNAGPLDLLGTVGDGLSYDDLLEDTIELSVSEDVRVPVLSLPALIRLKEKLGRDKDKAVLPILRRTVAESE